MNRARSILGITAGVLMLASSAAHSLLGWPQLRASLAQTNAPGDLVQGLALGWHFGGAAMLTFACIVLWTFFRRLKGVRTPVVPPAIIAIAYLLFGTGALAVSGDPFFFVFILPGLLLAAASFPRDGGERADS